MTTDPSPYLFWITARAAGITALVLASASVGLGLAMGGKLLRGSSPERRSLHEILALATIVAIAVHGLSLIADKWLHPTVFDVTVPFVSSYKTLPTALGILAGWGLVLFGLSSYMRKRIGVNRWRLIHRFTALAWLLGLVHTLTEGTDRGQPWFIALVVVTAAPVLVLLVVRLLKPRPAQTYRRSGTAGAARSRGNRDLSRNTSAVRGAAGSDVAPAPRPAA